MRLRRGYTLEIVVSKIFFIYIINLAVEEGNHFKKLKEVLHQCHRFVGMMCDYHLMWICIK